MRMFFPNTDLIDINIINFFIEVFGVVSIGFILFAGLRELRRLWRPGILNYNLTEKKEVLKISMCKAYVQTTYCKKCKGNNDKGFNIEFKKVKNYTQVERWEQKEQRSDNLISITEIFIQKRFES